MSDSIKIAGCCSLCDREVFDVAARFQAGEPNEGLPKQLGKPHGDAVRVAFLLASGEQIDLTFCEQCALGLAEEDYPDLWGKVLRSWVAEIGEAQRPAWLYAQLDNAILCELWTQKWSEVLKHVN